MASLTVIRPQNWTIWDDVLSVMKHGIRPPVNLPDLALTANGFGPYQGDIAESKRLVALVARL
jgi:hypothetical protein